VPRVPSVFQEIGDYKLGRGFTTDYGGQPFAIGKTSEDSPAAIIFSIRKPLV
jgi:hypothetical protein